MKKRSATESRHALDLVEEAVHLLRRAPARLWLLYYVGAIPFVLGLLHFVADMSVGAYAERRCTTSALGMAALFLWMKCWQTVFASGLRERLAGRPGERWDLRRAVRVLAVQGAIQPARLFLLPVAFPVIFVFPWALALFESATVLGDGTGRGAGEIFRRAGRQARLWWAQNLVIVLLLLLLAFVVWVNVFIALAAGPFLAKMLLGIETAFTRAGTASVFNTTFVLATLMLAYLAVDPLIKAVYVLRCFYGEARHDGADLIAELSFVRARREQMAAATVVLMLLVAVGARAADTASAPPVTPVPTASPTVSPTELDDALKHTLQRDKYSWRTPREEIVPDEKQKEDKGWLANFMQGVADTLSRWAEAIRHWIGKVFDWIDKFFTRKKTIEPREHGASNFTDWADLLRLFVYLLLAAAVAALAILLYRVWGRGSWRRRALLAEVLGNQPDLTDENVTAAQLPEDEWLKLAREMMDKGELRLALRALYLACLAHLAQREYVSIARFKSNRDYEREVARRARAHPDMCMAFAQNVAEFDRAWYGQYEVTRDGLQQFQGNLERIRSC